LRSGVGRQSNLVLPSITEVALYEISQCQSTSTGPNFMVGTYRFRKNLIIHGFSQGLSLGNCQVTGSDLS